jgi:fatty acid-binding protein DegV
LVMLLENAGFQPERAAFDVILLDVSGSMSSLYRTPAARADLDRLATLYPEVPVYFFDDRLIAPGGRAPWEEIDRHLQGGTNLEAALRELTQREPHVKRLLLVTDGDYGAAPSLDAYEATQCDPPKLGEMIRKSFSPRVV